jgi:hypothetical protein
MMDDFDDLTRRLRDLGAQPVDPDVAARCLNLMRRQRSSRSNLTKLKVAAAAATGFLVGSVGLAYGGTLPAPAQGVAHSVLKTVGVNVPPGHDRYNDPAACPGGPYRNHGAYVRAHKDDPNAGASPCGKPAHAVQKGGDGASGTDNSSKAPGHGPPPWAHGNRKEPKDDQGENHGKAGAAPQAGATTTTTALPPSTTSPPSTTRPSTTAAPSTTTTSLP